MNKIFLLFAYLVCTNSTAERADRNAKAVITYDGEMTHDSINGTTHAEGNVLVKKGSTIISSDILTIRENPNGFYISEVSTWAGRISKFKQKQDSGVERWLDAEGRRIEYDEETDVVTIFDRAKIKVSEGAETMEEANGSRISYDGRAERYIVRGSGDVEKPPNSRATLIIMLKH